jgi:hypothetical protein
MGIQVSPCTISVVRVKSSVLVPMGVTQLGLRQWWEECNETDAQQLLQRIQGVLPKTFERQMTLQTLVVKNIRLGPNRSYCALCLQSYIGSLSRSSLYWFFSSILLWAYTVSVALDSEILYVSTLIAINMLVAPTILYHIDTGQWRIVAATPHNIAVFLGSMMCVGLSFLLTESSFLSRVTLQLGFLSAAICFPTLEILDLPGFGLAFVLPPMVAFTIITSVKYHLSRVLCVSGIVDVLYPICIEGTCFDLSVTSIMDSIIVFNLGLSISKTKKVWDIYHGGICTSFGSNEYIRLCRSEYAIDARLSSMLLRSMIVGWHFLMMSVCMILLFVTRFFPRFWLV